MTPSRRSDVQGLRGVAVLLVVAFHAGLPLRGGFVGVDVFFVISGLVIGGVLLDEQARTGTVRLGRFLARRARRLLPLLAVVVGVTLVAHTAVTNPWTEPVVARTGIAALVMVANVYLYRHTGYFDASADDLNPFLHTWSLSVEEQLYVALPLVLLGTGAVSVRAGRGRTSVAVAGVAAVSAASFLLSWALVAGWAPVGVEAPERLGFFSPMTRFWEVGCGVLLAATRPRLARVPARVATIAAAVGAAAIAVAATTTDPLAPFPGPAALPAVLGTVLLLAGTDRAPAAASVAAVAPLRWIGDRSYGWYLWHWPAIVLTARLVPGSPLAAVLAATAALGLAAVTRPLVEERFRHDPRIVGARAVAFAVAVLAIPASLGVLAVAGADHGWGVREPIDWYEVSPGATSGCLIVNRDLPSTWDRERCTTSAERAEGTVLVVGDSAVGNVVPATVVAAEPRGLDVAEWARAGCPFTGRPIEDYPRCEEWQAAVWDLVDRLDPVALVVANRSLDHVGATTSPSPSSVRPELEGEGATVVRWRGAMSELADEAARRGLPLVVVGPVPDQGFRFPRTRLSPLQPDPPADPRSRADVDRQRAEVVTAERTALADRPRAAYVDPVAALCDEAQCPQVVDGQWLYADAHHLTIDGSRRLAPDLATAIDRARGAG